MGKPGVDAALVKLIKSPKASERATVLGVLASRRVESALPTLVELLNGTDAVLATEAAKALGVMGKSEQLKDLAGVIAKTSDAGLRSAGEEAAKAICRRSADKPAMAAMVLPSLAQANAISARISLLQVLSFTGGEPALNAVLKAMQDNDAALKTAATKVLVGWPEAAAGTHLVALAKSTPDASQAIVALRDGCLRLAEMDELPMTDRVAILRGVTEVAKRADEKKRAVAILADIPNLAALELLQACAKDATLQADAIKAILRLAKPLSAVYQKQTVAALQALQTEAPAEVRPQIETAIKAVQNSGQNADGFLVSWLLAGPFTREGKDGAALFDEVFPPEQTGGKAEWRPVTASKNGIMELDRLYQGDNRVAYLKTQIVSDKDQEVLLEMGSDDGIKVWLNGKVVYGNNSVRPCTPGSDKQKVKLAKGANSLLLKVTQGAGQWAACCRLRAADGKAVQDVIAGPSAE
jgi:HEAT repeat protein